MAQYLKNGKFYDRNTHKEVPLEYCNSEQIAILKKIERYQKEVERDGIEFNVTVKDVYVDFKCICGRYIKEVTEVDCECCEDTIYEAITNGIIVCDNCKKKYRFSDDGRLYII